MHDIFLRLIWLPSTINAVTVPDDSGNYNIYVNQNLCFNQQELAIKHELEHIRNKDFESYSDVSDLEEEIKKRIG